MIISHKYKFIFIKTTKTAGTSIEVFFSNISGDNDVLTPIIPEETGHFPKNYRCFFWPLKEISTERRMCEKVTSLKQFLLLKKYYNHIPGWKIKARINKEIWDSYFKFCVERNPWEKVLSNYYMLLNRAGNMIDFEQYIHSDLVPINYPKYMDYNCGEIIVDKVIRYDELNDELGTVFNNLGVPFNGNLETKSKSTFKKNPLSYKDIFLKEFQAHIETVGKIFKKEIELFDFQF